MKNQTFGIEIETTGLGCERTAKAIAAHFGTTARYVGRHLGDWHIPMPDGRKWVVERDASVTAPCAEVVSPVCRWEDIPMVQEVVRALREAGARTDSSCGIHVHVGFGQHTPQSLRRLVNIVNAKEDLLTMALGISQHRREEWCRPVDQRFLEALNRAKPDTLECFAAIWYRHNSEAGYHWEMLARHHYDHSRYHLLNLHAAFSLERPARTIEFRAFNGTLHAGKIKAYIQLCLAISAQALMTKAASPTCPVTDNPKYTFRCWLLRLGFIGDEFEQPGHTCSRTCPATRLGGRLPDRYSYRIERRHTMPTTAYMIRFAHHDPSTSAPYEEQEYTTLATAWESFRLFAEPDNAEVYSQIELVEYSYTEDTERLIARMEFSF